MFNYLLKMLTWLTYHVILKNFRNRDWKKLMKDKIKNASYNDKCEWGKTLKFDEIECALENILSKEDLKAIKDANSDEEMRSASLLGKIKDRSLHNKSDSIIDYFIDVLFLFEQNDAIKLLSSYTIMYIVPMSINDNDIKQIKNSMIIKQHNGQIPKVPSFTKVVTDNCQVNNIEILGSKLIDKKSTYQATTSHQTLMDEDDHYDMSGEPGFAVALFNYKSLSPIFGAREEKDLITRLYKFLGFKVFSFENMSREDTFREFKVIRDQISAAQNAFAFYVLSHGQIIDGESVFHTCEEEKKEPQSFFSFLFSFLKRKKPDYIKFKEVEEFFGLKKCTRLAKKPRWFTYNCCRIKNSNEAKEDNGIIYEVTNHTLGNTQYDVKSCSPLNDIIRCYATSKFYVGYQYGDFIATPFAQILNEVCRNFAPYKDLNYLIFKTNDVLSRMRFPSKNGNSQACTQVMQIKGILRKQLRFLKFNGDDGGDNDGGDNDGGDNDGGDNVHRGGGDSAGGSGDTPSNHGGDNDTRGGGNSAGGPGDAPSNHGGDDETPDTQHRPKDTPNDVQIRLELIHGYHNRIKLNQYLYKMSSLPRGYCYIINNVHFTDPRLQTRYGSYEEARDLISVFSKLHFQTILQLDLSAKDVITKLANLAKSSDLISHDALVVIILSHGYEGGLFGSDGHVIQCETVFELFNDKNCPGLRDKPKLFFIMSCRDNRQNYSGKREPEIPKEPKIPKIVFVPETNEFKHCSTMSDMLICYSTTPGDVSYRDTIKGSWFGSELASALLKHAKECELQQILHIVSKNVMERNMESTGLGRQSTEFIFRGWRKNLYFNPGLASRDERTNQLDSTDVEIDLNQVRRDHEEREAQLYRLSMI